MDVAAGYPLPVATSDVVRLRRTKGSHPLHALAATAEEIVTGGRRVFVAFSGGRDSSAVLSLLARAARRVGAPAPIALTHVWPNLPETDEREWQAHVLSHFPEVQHVIVDVTDEHELLGPLARTSLASNGVLWPPTSHGHEPLLRTASGGVLVDGEGGDELFGPTRLRILRHLPRRRPSLPLLRAVASATSPRPVRRALHRGSFNRSWLEPSTARSVTTQLATENADAPLSAASEILSVPGRRSWSLGEATLEGHARRHDVVRRSPLLEPGPVRAIAERAGHLGWKSRTDAMTDVFGDVVPHEVLTRTSKADFSRAVWGPSTMQWLSSWDRRSGVDPRLVDAPALAAVWKTDVPPAATALLAQAAWLAQEVGREALHRHLAPESLEAGAGDGG